MGIFEKVKKTKTNEDNILSQAQDDVKRDFRLGFQPNKTKLLSKYDRKIGFTLAEVLITLTIIGVVAAFTIPTLISNYQKKEYVTALKKAYTEFNQALISISNDMGCVGDLKCTKLFDGGTDNQTLGTEFVKYFKVIKNCESSDGGPTITGCFSDSISGSYDGSSARDSMLDHPSLYRFITEDGMIFVISSYKHNCEEDFSQNITNNMTKVCGGFYVDVNGLKGPNNFGRDIFSFHITNGKGPLLYPRGGLDDDYDAPWQDSDGNPLHCYHDETTSGSYCTGRVIEEGWQMNY